MADVQTSNSRGTAPWRAALPMYDLPELRAAHERLWARIAEALRDANFHHAPSTLTWDEPPESTWRAPDLLFGQTCGYPLMTELRDSVRVVGAPVYRAEGAVGATYRSIIIVPNLESASSIAGLRGAVAAINQRGSHSGENALRHLVAPHASNGHYFAEVVETGSHLASVELVARGRADVAAIDSVTLTLLAKLYPDLVARVRRLTMTESVPSLPFITAADESTATILRGALNVALADPELADVRETLLLESVEPVTHADYEPIVAMEADAGARGYPEIR
ncbi:MAG: PhnD/SsuA/transferrin family substrate-binding protein [Polyangiales bacterium]|nr:PhnD/SsuA/transferrin family substrate-binding protein [Myxococcales bacterium]